MKCLRAIALSLFIWACAGSASASSASASCSSPDYDIRIAAAVARWWRDIPARDAFYSWKAQLCQESRLDPLAVSPAGAKGLAQFMDPTWADEAPKAGYAGRSVLDPSAAIDVGASYMAGLRRFWKTAVDPDKHRLAQGSYNAGAGNIRKASRLCGNALAWSQVKACLPQVTGRNAVETITYVDRIARYQKEMSQ